MKPSGPGLLFVGSLDNQQGYCKALGILLNVMWQPGWEGSLRESEYMYMYGWVPSLFNWNYHNIVNQLYPNTKYKSLKKKMIREMKKK